MVLRHRLPFAYKTRRAAECKCRTVGLRPQPCDPSGLWQIRTKSQFGRLYHHPGKRQVQKTLFIDFAIHGFEDDYARDGRRLTTIANHLIAHFASHPEELGNYRLVIVPCANPDGAIAGKNAQRSGKNAFGRRTAAHIDINRDFGPFKGKETRALRDFILRKEAPCVHQCPRLA